MPTILRRLPFFTDVTSLRIPDGPVVAIKHHQIIIWVGLAPVGNPNPPSDMHRFPALLDTGFNGNFLLREDHLSLWAKTTLSESTYNLIGTNVIHGELVPTFEADLWIFGNIPGFRDQVSDAHGVPWRSRLVPEPHDAVTIAVTRTRRIEKKRIARNDRW